MLYQVVDTKSSLVILISPILPHPLRHVSAFVVPSEPAFVHCVERTVGNDGPVFVCLAVVVSTEALWVWRQATLRYVYNATMQGNAVLASTVPLAVPAMVLAQHTNIEAIRKVVVCLRLHSPQGTGMLLMHRLVQPMLFRILWCMMPQASA